jgi:glycosyltransferase involved in cell wall biosynthesis
VLAWTLRNASALTAISEDCKTHALNAGANESSITVVMNGADLRRFSPAPARNAPNQFGSRMIFACRQLFPRKGIRFLIEAVAKLKPKYPDINLVIAGDGFERPALEELAQTLGIGGKTKFLGWVANKELPQYFRSCAVSVIPSLEEGFGIPAAEAMGCEKPVVATDAGGLPEVVENGVTGFVVPKGDAEALANAIDRLLADDGLRRQMGEAGRARALGRFDWDLSVRSFEAVYASVLNKNGPGSARPQGLNILKTSYEYPPLGGGGAKVVYGIATRLAARGHNVDLVTMGFRGLPATQNVDGVNVKRISRTRLRISTCSFIEMVPYVLLAPLYLIKNCRSKRYLVNHTHFIFPGGVISYVLKWFTVGCAELQSKPLSRASSAAAPAVAQNCRRCGSDLVSKPVDRRVGQGRGAAGAHPHHSECHRHRQIQAAREESAQSAGGHAHV